MSLSFSKSHFFFYSFQWGIVPYISALESGDTELAEGDAALIALDEYVLELEEITKMPRAGNEICFFPHSAPSYLVSFKFDILFVVTGLPLKEVEIASHFCDAK